MNPKDLERYYLGEVRTEEDPASGDMLMIVSSTYTAKGELDALVRNLRERRKLKHENLIELRKIETDARSSWCATTYHLRSTYEYLPNSLRKEILLRRRKNLCFNAVELLRLAYDAVDVLAYLQESDIKHGEINPTLIFLHPDRFDEVQRAKLCERFTGAGDRHANYLNAVSANVDLYLSPDTFEALASNRRRQLLENPYKKDVFGLGLCLLEAGLLVSVQCLFNKVRGGFAGEKLAELRGRFGSLYAGVPILTFLLEQMLQPAEERRPDFLQLKGALPAWAEVIDFVRKNPAVIRPEGDICRINRTLEESEHSYARSLADNHRSAESFIAELESVKDAAASHRAVGVASVAPPFAFSSPVSPITEAVTQQSIYPEVGAPRSAAPAFDYAAGGPAAAYPFPGGANHVIQPPPGPNALEDFFSGVVQPVYAATLAHAPGHHAAAYQRFERSSSLADFTDLAAQPPLNESLYEKNNIPRTYRSETGTVYRSVTEERLELNDRGEQVRRIYVKYQPVAEQSAEPPARKDPGLAPAPSPAAGPAEQPTIVQSFSYTPTPGEGLAEEESKQTLSQFMNHLKSPEWRRGVEESLTPLR